jgi:hypothetical protein
LSHLLPPLAADQPGVPLGVVDLNEARVESTLAQHDRSVLPGRFVRRSFASLRMTVKFEPS